MADHFLRRSNEENEKNLSGFTKAAHDAMLDYPWPGNVRELQHAIEQAVVLCQGTEIDIADLPIESPSPEANHLRVMIPGLTMAELERYAILRTLDAVGGSTSKAASLLSISRRRIQYRLQEWGLSGYARASGEASSDVPPDAQDGVEAQTEPHPLPEDSTSA